MDPIATALLNKSLDGLWMRYAATAENIANASSRDFRPLRVTFENLLRDAAPAGAGSIRGVVPVVRRDVASVAGADMRLDLELATASTTALRYSALLDLLGREMQITRSAISGGQ